MMRTAVLLAAVLLLGSCVDGAPEELLASTERFESVVDLPEPDLVGTVTLEETLGVRRSRRTFSPEPLELKTLGQLLWAGQGITEASLVLEQVAASGAAMNGATPPVRNAAAARISCPSIGRVPKPA